MRILHVFEIGLIGGAFRVVELLAKAQRRAGQDSAVLVVAERSDAESHPLVKSLADAGVEVTTTVLEKSRAYLQERQRTVEEARRLQVDVVHTHDYRTDVIDGTAARAAGFATVSTLHGFTQGGLRNRLYQRIQWWTVRRGDAVVAVSNAMRKRLLELGFPADLVHVVPNAVSTHERLFSREEARARLGVERDGFRVGWVGRLNSVKGPDVLLQSLHRLNPVPRVSVVGEGPMREELQVISAPQVKWHGAVHGADMLFRAFDVLVMSSRSEGTPLVLLEAMRAEVPVVATRVGGIPEVVASDEALLVPPEDPGALAQAIDAIRNDPADAARRARAARSRLDRDFTPEAWVAAYQDVYRDALARRDQILR